MPSSPRPQPSQADDPRHHQPGELGPRRPLAPQDTAGDQPQDHRRQGGNEAERRVAAAVVPERLGTGEQVEEPDVERPGRVAVLVPVGREAAHQMRPVRRNADSRVIEIGTHRIGREEGPVAYNESNERQPLHANRPHAQQEEERVAQADLREGVFEREVGRRWPIERRKTPRKTSTSDRQTACADIQPETDPRPAGWRGRTAVPRRPGTRTRAGSCRGAPSRSIPRATGDGKETPRSCSRATRGPPSKTEAPRPSSGTSPARGKRRSIPAAGWGSGWEGLAMRWKASRKPRARHQNSSITP